MKNLPKSPIPEFDHNPNAIHFRGWMTPLSLDGEASGETGREEAVLFLKENDTQGAERIPVRSQVCFGNPTRFAHLNVTLVEKRSHREVFFAQELPAGRFMHLGFLKEGAYTLYSSPAFSPITLRREIQVFTPVKDTHSALYNISLQLQPRLRTPLLDLNFSSRFPEYKDGQDLPTPKDQDGTAGNTKRKLRNGIVGAVCTAGSALGYWMDSMWTLMPGVWGVTLLQSGTTGLSPLYYILGKTGRTG